MDVYGLFSFCEGFHEKNAAKKQEPLQRRDVMQALSVDKSLGSAKSVVFFSEKKTGIVKLQSLGGRETMQVYMVISRGFLYV